MSLFIAVPSERDIQDRFDKRLGFWEQKLEWIYVRADGNVKKAPPNSAFVNGLVLLSPTYLKQETVPTAALELVGKALGVFIHPGGEDTPNLAQAEEALENVPNKLLVGILAKAVAFSIKTPNPTYSVPELSLLWNWLSTSDDTPCPCTTLADLSKSYSRLWQRETLRPLLNVVVQLEGVAFPSAAEECRLQWADELRGRLNAKEWNWLAQEPEVGTPLSEFLRPSKSESLDEVAAKALSFRDAIRTLASRFSEVGNE